MVENEIQFLSWQKFQRMAPAIVQLEVTRIERLMPLVTDNPDLYNSLVRARFELNAFLRGLEEENQESLKSACAPHLRAAILALSVDEERLSTEIAGTLSYIGDRLNHVHDRMVLLY